MRNKIIKIEDVIGKKYNFLTVIKEVDPVITTQGYKCRKWLFRCDCGKEKIITPSNVFRGSIKSCGCKKKEINLEKINNYYKLKYNTPVENRLFSNYAYYWKPNREFSLTKDEFIELVNSNCYYCNRPPFTVRYNKTKSVSKKLNGIDRIDSSLGYVKGNVVPCCIDCNRAKMDNSKEYFLEWVKIVYNNIYGKKF